MQNNYLSNFNKNKRGGVIPSFFFRLIFVFVLLFVLFDNAKPPNRQKLVNISVKLLDFYKVNLSKPAAEKHNIKFCRFHPSCSVYAKQALLKYGFFKGLYLTTVRIIKCNPFYGKPIMEDPVP
jgi:putative membrane protein insertion efficiency factor